MYYVFGGQYEKICIGSSKTLHGAKCIASKNVELWDNWQGWHTPDIYPEDQTEVIASRSRVTTYDGQQIRVPKSTGHGWKKTDGNWEKF